MRRVCLCRCHQLHRGDQRAAAHAGRFLDAFHAAQAGFLMDGVGVDPEDALYAAAACAECRPRHAVALSSRRDWTRPLPDRPRIAGRDTYSYDPTGDTD